jgi:2-oxoglutarate ferredoxin oxidoreductase subunit alpha
MNFGQISREIKRVNISGCQVKKHNRLDGQMITPAEIYKELSRM